MEDEDGPFAGPTLDGVPGLADQVRQVYRRQRVGAFHHQQAAGGGLAQRLAHPQHGQGAFQAAQIERNRLHPCVIGSLSRNRQQRGHAALDRHGPRAEEKSGAGNGKAGADAGRSPDLAEAAMARLSAEEAGETLLTIEQAAALALAAVTPVGEPAALPLAEADGRVLAGDVVAPLPLPPFANAAVDGYALRHADLARAAETRLPVLGRVAAGATAPLLSGVGAVRIFTGAPVPEGADSIAMQEHVRREGDGITLSPGLRPGAHIRPAGEDVAQGAAVFAAGHRLRPQDVGLLAALGLERVAVLRRPRVALFSTGDELTEPGQPLAGAAIYDANRAMLRALLVRAGADPVDLGILRDDRDRLAQRLGEAAQGCDLVMTSGGVSVGEEDHVKAAVAAQGALDLWRIAIKPGKPVAFGRIGTTPFIGLPGNPVAVFVTFALLARPVIARLAGTACLPLQRLTVTLGFAHRKQPGRREFLRASLQPGANGGWIAHRHPGIGAGSLVSLSQSDGLVELAEESGEAGEGSLQPFLPYAGLLG